MCFSPLSGGDDIAATRPYCYGCSGADRKLLLQLFAHDLLDLLGDLGLVICSISTVCWAKFNQPWSVVASIQLWFIFASTSLGVWCFEASSSFLNAIIKMAETHAYKVGEMSLCAPFLAFDPATQQLLWHSYVHR